MNTGQNDRTSEGSHEPGFPRHPGIWILLTTILSFWLGVPLLYIFTIVPTAVGLLLSVWVAVALRRGRKRHGRRNVVAVAWIMLAGLSPDLVLWITVLPQLISRMSGGS